MWKDVNKRTLLRTATDHGVRWHFGAADSPWLQGAVEALVKSAKQCLKFSMHSQRLSPSEFHTVCYQATNTLNERPLQYLPSADAD